MKKFITLLSLITLISINAHAQQEETTKVKGVNPADNLTKIEILPKLSIIDDKLGISVNTLTLKYDKAIKGIYGANFELPFARFEGLGEAENGIGDLNVRFRAQHKVGRFVGIVGVEGVLPTATDKMLGSGKYQVNPTAVGVYAFTNNIFAAGIIKEFISVGGQSSRDIINQTQGRLLIAYTSQDGWWLLLDPQIWANHEINGQEYLMELELGTMVGPTTGVWIRGGKRLGGDWERSDWTIGGGIRFLKF